MRFISRLSLTLCLFICACTACFAQNWDEVRNSGLYYYGEGIADTEAEADKMALAALSSMIATQVSNTFTSTSDQINKNGEIDHVEYAQNCIRTYSQTTLTNCNRQLFGSGRQQVVHRWMLRSELDKLFDSRIDKAKSFVKLGGDYLERNSVGLALQYYYWAYALVSSVQYPDKVKDADGKSLTVILPVKIREVLSDIEVKYKQRDGEYVDMYFLYHGAPISSELYFDYNDGRSTCTGTAKDGIGSLEMVQGFAGDYYHLTVDYACLNRATDAEIESVLNTVWKPAFSGAEKAVKAPQQAVAATQQAKSASSASTNQQLAALAPSEKHGPAPDVIETGLQLKPKETLLVDDNTRYDAVVRRIMTAIGNRRYSDVTDCFTLDGLEVFNKLVAYGRGRIVSEPTLHYFKSQGGTVVVRGLQMSFSFTRGVDKRTFVEDVAFTFDADGKICNVAFGLGKNVENDVLGLAKKEDAFNWDDEFCELFMEFLENYKTAYSLKRIDYIRDIFADDALIIVGNVVRRSTSSQQGKAMSERGRDIIRYNRYTKDEYIDHLASCFRRNEFVNIRFTKSDIQGLEKLGKVVGVQLGQDYQSSTYSDFGYLYLMIDYTDPNNPFIKIRTWQEKPDPKFNWYNAGDFFGN